MPTTRLDRLVVITVLGFCVLQLGFIVYKTLQVWNPSFGWWIRTLFGMTIFVCGPGLIVLWLRRWVYTHRQLAFHLILLTVLCLGNVFGLSSRYYGNYGDGGGGYVLAAVLLCEWLVVALYASAIFIRHRHLQKRFFYKK